MTLKESQAKATAACLRLTKHLEDLTRASVLKETTRTLPGNLTPLEQWNQLVQALRSAGFSTMNADEAVSAAFPGLWAQANAENAVRTRKGPPMTKTELLLRKAEAFVHDGTYATLSQAVDAVCTAHGDLYEQQRKEPPAPVQKAVLPTPPPEHWSVTELRTRVETLKQRQPALSHTEAWGQVMKSAEGQTLVEAHYESNKHLRRQG